jgi:hypothetical protein
MVLASDFLPVPNDILSTGDMEGNFRRIGDGIRL